MEELNSKILFNFVGNFNNIIFSGYKIFDKIYDFNQTEITFRNDIFEPKTEKKKIDFHLIHKNDTKKSLSFKCYVYLGVNIAYCYIDATYKILFDICFLVNNFKLNLEGVELKYNSLENDPRTRIILINSPITLDINDDHQNLIISIPKNLSKNTSFEIAAFDSSLETYLIRPILGEKKNNNDIIEVEVFIKNNKNILKEFYNNFLNVTEKKEQNKEIFKALLKESHIKMAEIIFVKRKEQLKELYKDEESYYLFYLYSIWYLLNLYFSNDKTKRNVPFIDAYNYLKGFYEKYQNDNDLLIYQKVLLLFSNLIYFIKLDDIEKYKNSELEYVNMKDVKKNSVYELSIKFLNDFINNLNSKSELFFPLLLLDSGVYYYDEKTFCYGFDFQSCEKIKEHLRELIPDVFFVYKKKDLLNSEKGYNFKGLEIIFLNKLTVLENYNGNPKEEDKNINIVKHYATRTSKFFMHESFGHNKILFEQNDRVQSPRHFYNKKNKFITMIPKVAKSIFDPENTFYINQEKFGGESGNFLEYFFGLYNDELVIDLLYHIPNIGKLIDNVEYFTAESLENLRNYIIYKFKLKEKGIIYHDKENSELKDDIKEMEKIIKDKNIILQEKIPQKEEKSLNQIKKDEKQKILFVEIDETEEKGYTYYMNKMLNAKTNEESAEYAWELILNHLQKE